MAATLKQLDTFDSFRNDITTHTKHLVPIYQKLTQADIAEIGAYHQKNALSKFLYRTFINRFIARHNEAVYAQELKQRLAHLSNLYRESLQHYDQRYNPEQIYEAGDPPEIKQAKLQVCLKKIQKDQKEHQRAFEQELKSFQESYQAACKHTFTFSFFPSIFVRFLKSLQTTSSPFALIKTTYDHKLQETIAWKNMTLAISATPEPPAQQQAPAPAVNAQPVANTPKSRKQKRLDKRAAAKQTGDAVLSTASSTEGVSSKPNPKLTKWEKVAKKHIASKLPQVPLLESSEYLTPDGKLRRRIYEPAGIEGTQENDVINDIPQPTEAEKAAARTHLFFFFTKPQIQQQLQENGFTEKLSINSSGETYKGAYKAFARFAHPDKLKTLRETDSIQAVKLEESFKNVSVRMDTVGFKR